MRTALAILAFVLALLPVRAIDTTLAWDCDCDGHALHRVYALSGTNWVEIAMTTDHSVSLSITNAITLRVTCQLWSPNLNTNVSGPLPEASSAPITLTPCVCAQP